MPKYTTWLHVSKKRRHRKESWLVKKWHATDCNCAFLAGGHQRSISHSTLHLQMRNSPTPCKHCKSGLWTDWSESSQPIHITSTCVSDFRIPEWKQSASMCSNRCSYELGKPRCLLAFIWLESLNSGLRGHNASRLNLLKLSPGSISSKINQTWQLLTFIYAYTATDVVLLTRSVCHICVRGVTGATFCQLRSALLWADTKSACILVKLDLNISDYNKIAGGWTLL